MSKPSSKSKAAADATSMELDEGDEILKEVLGESDSSISSLDVSEDEGKSSETNTKKRKRDKQESEPTEEADTTDTILMKRIPVKKACFDVVDIMSDDIQLWLFKVPDTMDISSLNGSSFKVGGTVVTGGGEYQISEGSTLESDALVNIWPDVKSGKMRLGKPFSKLVHVAEAPKASSTQATQIVQNLAAFLKFGTTRNTVAAKNYDENDTPELKVRYAPAGAHVPVSSTTSSSATSASAVESKSSHSVKEGHEHKSHKEHKEGKHKHKEGKHKHKK